MDRYRIFVGTIRTGLVGGMKRALGPLGFQINFVRGDVTAPSTQTGIEYWRDGLERKMPRWYEITWRGRRIIRVRSAHNERTYWRPR